MATTRHIVKNSNGNESESITNLNLSYGQSTVEVDVTSKGIIRDLYANTATIQTANVVNANISNSTLNNIIATNATITNITSSQATLVNIQNTNIVSTLATITNITATYITVNEIRLNKENETASTLVGGLTWNNVDKCIDTRLSTDVVIQNGQELLLRVYNNTGSDIANGKLVYISGASGNRPTIALTSNTSYTNSIKLIGMTTELISKNEYGFVCIYGKVRGLNTQGIGEGTILYLDTNGNYTITKPTPPTICIRVGMIVKEHVSDGEISFCLYIDKNNFGSVDTGSYSYFENTGILVNVGNAMTWDDIPPNPILRSRQAAVNNPTLATLVGGIQQYTFAINDYVMDNLEFPHMWKEASSMNPHIHWATNGTTTSDTHVAWELEYTIANGAATPTLSIQSFSTTSVVSVNTIIPANTADRSHFISSFPTATLTNYKIGALICYNIKRITANGTAPANNPFGIQVSAHYQKDTQGSRYLYIK